MLRRLTMAFKLKSEDDGEKVHIPHTLEDFRESLFHSQAAAFN
jgi:hypothetical protein